MIILPLNIYCANRVNKGEISICFFFFFFSQGELWICFCGYFYGGFCYLGFLCLLWGFLFVCFVFTRGLWRQTCKICESAGAQRAIEYQTKCAHSCSYPGCKWIGWMNTAGEKHRSDSTVFLTCCFYGHPRHFSGNTLSSTGASRPIPVCRHAGFIFWCCSKKGAACAGNGIFHYLARLCWMSHQSRLVLAGLVSTQGIAWQRLRGLASFTEMWGC